MRWARLAFPEALAVRAVVGEGAGGELARSSSAGNSLSLMLFLPVAPNAQGRQRFTASHVGMHDLCGRAEHERVAPREARPAFHAWSDRQGDVKRLFCGASVFFRREMPKRRRTILSGSRRRKDIEHWTLPSYSSACDA